MLLTLIAFKPGFLRRLSAVVEIAVKSVEMIKGDLFFFQWLSDEVLRPLTSLQPRMKNVTAARPSKGQHFQLRASQDRSSHPAQQTQ